MKRVGIWLDKRTAFVVTLNGKGERVERINSEVDEGHVKGGSRSSVPYGPQDIVQEKGLLEKRKQQLKKYFSNLIKFLKGTQHLLIIGPADTKVAFEKEIQKYQELNHMEVWVKNADSMTLPQIKALVRDYFNRLRRTNRKPNAP